MSVSLCAFQLELAADSLIPQGFRYLAPKYQNSMASKPEDPGKNVPHKEGKKKEKSWTAARGKRELQEIVIETYENEDSQAPTSSGAKSKKGGLKASRSSPKSSSFDTDLPSTSKEPSPALSQTAIDGESVCSSEIGSVSQDGQIERKKFKDQMSFMSGNPFVEVVKGILHFYKENQMTSLEEDVPRSQLICMLAIPAWLTCHDLLHFLAPCCPGIRRVRIIRDATPNQYMALVLFRTQEEADEFYKTFNGTPYNSMESELCHLVYVARVEICGDAVDSDQMGRMDVPMTGHTELPTCTVCLERMDESVDGILTILCNHSFHGACLAKWSDTTCPVCRYLQSPEVSADSFCSECKSVESLWICLICGHVGCGRYVGGHAHNHFLETQHCYAMQLGNSRVWDYVGDNFVHRLLQNKADGKLVEVEGNNNGHLHDLSKVETMEHEDKLDSVQLEYTYLLTRQLESQRIYFEEVVHRLEQQHRQEKEETKERVKTALEKFGKLEQELMSAKKEKEQIEKKLNTKLTKALSDLSKAVADLQEEKALNRSLVANQATWQQRVSELERQVEHIRQDRDKSVAQLEEQLRDVYLHLEARDKMKDSELEGGQVSVGLGSPSSSRVGPGSDRPGSKGTRNKRRGK